MLLFLTLHTVTTQMLFSLLQRLSLIHILNVHFKSPTDDYVKMFEQMEQDKIISTRGLKPIDTMQTTAHAGIFIAMFAALLVTASISAFVGCKMLKKQFEKAGITA